jgi:hypothetical protein
MEAAMFSGGGYADQSNADGENTIGDFHPSDAGGALTGREIARQIIEIRARKTS